MIDLRKADYPTGFHKPRQDVLFVLVGEAQGAAIEFCSEFVVDARELTADIFELCGAGAVEFLEELGGG
jgi:hypothetical protein